MLTEKLHTIYEDAAADALFLTCDFLRRYLTGFYSTDGYVILTAQKCYFVADMRYFEAAQRALAGSAVTVVEGSRKKALELAEDCATLGVPYPYVSLSECADLQSAGHKLTDCMPALRSAMLYKTQEELSCIQTACTIAEDAFNSILSEIREGMKEREVAALLEYRMRQLGASGTSFETIVAFGENGSIPHYETGERALKFGDPVLIDFGCKFGGYCSDITRSFLFGDDKEHEEYKRLHAVVLAAHTLVKEQVHAGMTGAEADAVARDFFKAQGLDGYFTHSLGHGIGLQIHEYPTLSPRGEEKLADGMVFSDEPGLYFEGKLGIRVEDSCYMQDGKVVSFMTKTDRHCTIL